MMVKKKDLDALETFLSQELLKTLEDLEEKKADKQMVEREIVRGFV